MGRAYANPDPPRKGQSQKSTAARVGPRPGTPKSTDERDFVLPLFRAARREGINRNHFLKGTGPLNGRQVTQIGRLVHHLEKEGYQFIHARRDDSPFVYYVLVAEPLEPRKPMQTERSADMPPTLTKPIQPAQQDMFAAFMDYETGRRVR